MSASRGKELERAVGRAARAYRKEGRALLIQQYPRMAVVHGFVQEVGTAPADFMGAIGDMAAAVECKECERTALPLDYFGEGQPEALDAIEEYGFRVELIVEMLKFGEIYLVPWFQVAAFRAAPWRKSLSIDWLRAYGQVVPTDGTGDTRKVLFLEAKAHPESERCMLDVWDERASKPVISLDAPDEPEVEPKPSPYKGLSTDEVRARLMDAMQVGTERQLKKPKREWKRRRGVA